MAKEDSARTFFEKLKIVEKFCAGDVEMAKKILKGEYTDIIALKGRFKDDEDNFFGLFLVFVSRISQKVIHASTVTSHTVSVFYNKPFESWKVFFDKIDKEIKEAQVDEELTRTMDQVLSRMHELKLFENFFELITHRDIMNLTEKFEKIVSNVLKVEKSHVLLDFENLTSLVLYDEKGIKPI